MIEPAPRREPGTVTPLTRFVTRHPVGAFSVTAFGLGWPLLFVRSTTSFASTAVGLAFTWGALLGSALAVTWVCGGAPAVRGLLARLVQWRFGLRRWAYVVLALPALTVATAALSGTLVLPSGGWAALVAGYLLQTFVYGAAEVNVAEEGAWSGLVQTRLAERYGVLGGALRTAPLFVAMHVPLQFTPGWTWGEVGIGLAVLAVVAPFFRYLLGETLQATGGSVLAAGVLHAAFNASGQLGFPGGWQFLPALVVLALGVGLHRRFGRVGTDGPGTGEGNLLRRRPHRRRRPGSHGPPPRDARWVPRVDDQQPAPLQPGCHRTPSGRAVPPARPPF